MKPIFKYATKLGAFAPAIAALFVVSCQNSPVPADNQSDAEIIEYSSFNVDFDRDVYRSGLLGKPKVSLNGRLYLPDGEGPFPVVIYQHGSGVYQHGNGIYQHGSGNADLPQYKRFETSLHNQLRTREIGFFIADSYSGRGIGDSSRDQSQLSRTSRIIDALRALEVLARHPQIDASKIGITGKSFGGAIAFGASHEPFAKLILPDGPRFAAHAPLYPSCQGKYEPYVPTGAPFLFLLGGADDYTDSKYCTSLIDDMKAAGTSVESVVYPGAHHGFISSKPVYFNKDVWTFNECGIFKIGRDGEMRAPAGTSEGKTWSEFIKQFVIGSGCASRGAHIGRNLRQGWELTVKFWRVPVRQNK